MLSSVLLEVEMKMKFFWFFVFFFKFSQNKPQVRQIVFFPSPRVSSVCLLGKKEKFREFTTMDIDPGQLSVRL